MELLENIVSFMQRYFTVEVIIMTILIIGTFVAFSFFVQDLFQDYFRDYQEKQKLNREAETNGEKPPGGKPKIKKKPRTKEKPEKRTKAARGIRAIRGIKPTGKTKAENRMKPMQSTASRGKSPKGTVK